MKLPLLLPVMLLGTNSLFAQLPDDPITKITWDESKEVTYEFVDSNSINCLTLGELSQYQGYEQHYRQTHVVDSFGDVLSEQEILHEWNVRDDWMEDFSRIVVGKDSTRVYDANNQLFHTVERTIDSGAEMLTPEESVNYRVLLLDENYLTQLQDTFTLHNIPYTVNNGILSASDTQLTFVYDHNTKVMMTTEYDSFMFKTRETAIEYDFSDDSSTYAPLRETIIEWFLSKNGCCVRKTTVITRTGYYRIVNDIFMEQASPSEHDYTEQQREEDFKILSIAGSDQFIVQSEARKGEQVTITIYDLSGKQLFNGTITEGEVLRLPVSARPGMYLVHVIDSSNRTVVGKILNPNSGNRF